MIPHTKYMISPNDIATFLFLENTSHKRENEILLDLFNNHNKNIVREYRRSYLKLKQCVMNLISIYEVDATSYSEATLILRETTSSKICSVEESDCFSAYFKLIWLQLIYSGITYRKIKLRKLLRDFGYKRRSEKLINCIQQAIDNLNLRVYLRDYTPCNINDIDIDDMIIIRSADQNIHTQ